MRHRDDPGKPAALGGTARFGPLTRREFARPLVRAVALLVAAAGTLVLVDALIFVAASLGPIHVDVAVWGTYAAWASAVLPTFGLMATVGMWLVNQRLDDVADAVEVVNRVFLVTASGAVVVLRNESDSPITVVKCSPPIADVSGEIVRPHSHDLLLASDTLEVTVEARTCSFAIGIDGRVKRLS